MERAMSVEERIRRAEERYNRKMGQTSFKSESRFNINENRIQSGTRKKSKKKLIFQAFICLLIYLCFYTITNSEYIFSEEFKGDVNSFFTEKTKIYEIYTDIKSYIDENILNNKEDKKSENETKNTEENKENAEENKPEENKESDNNNSQNVGGSEEVGEEKQEEKKEEVAEVKEKEPEKEETQMEKDAKEIKSKLSFINPIEGRITSTFGWRNPSVPTVPKYHTGLDIAAVQGTVIKSATDGTIATVSSVGDYGKHYLIKDDNITIIYAHCSKLYLKEGTVVKQGQEIAEVGTTRKFNRTTSSHWYKTR